MGKDQEFLEAARNGNVGYIEKVLTQKAKRAGPLASLRRGTGVNVQDSGGYSALHHACLNGHHDIVRLLLAHEASPNLPDSRGSSPLHLASWAGETEIVKMLLTHPYRPASANLQTIENETPLHCAAQHGHQGALALLLAHDADPNMRNSRGETPLDLAAQYGRLQAVQMLIRAHPELIAPFSSAAIEGNHQQQPLHERISQTHNKSRHSSPLPHSGSVSTPSPSSPSVNSSSPATPTRNIFPHTCLHLASRNGHKNVVEVLLAAGVCVNLQTPSGTALHEAALCGKENVVRTLLKAGIDLNATDAEGRTALDILKEFPPHVTKHIIAVINNFRNQMDTDEGEDGVIYRHHPQLPPAISSAAAAAARSGQLLHHQKQQHNNHYHFNSNNHLLNHSHSMQQSSYSKQRFSTGGGGGVGNFNGGKSLDSSLQPDDVGGSSGGSNNRFYHDINSPVHSHSNTSHNELGISPSSSMSSFEPASVSPRSRSSTGGIIGYGNQTVHMSTFAPATAPPKKPPRRNLSVSPTHTGQQQQFSYTSPNHQQQLQNARRQQRSPSNDSPYSHQSHGSVGGMSFDEMQMRERQRKDPIYASARESSRSAVGVPLSSSNDMLDRQSSSATGSETFVSNSLEETNNSHSIKRPIPAPRKNSTNNNNGTSTLSKEIISCENPTLKSYNPNRKLKRNRNSYSIGMTDKEQCSQSSDSNSDPKQQIPSSPTNYKQPPTPDHPPPSSSQAERTIHERIRPLSQEYKRRSALLQMQQQQQNQQINIDSNSTPPKPIVIATTSYEFAYDHSPPTNTVIPFYHASGTQGSSGSLSSSISCSEHSLSTDCVEEYVSDAPFAGLLKGATCQSTTYEWKATKNVSDAEKDKEAQQSRAVRPPIPTKPMLPERKLIKPQPPPRKDNDTKSEQSICSNTTNGLNKINNGESVKISHDEDEAEKLSTQSISQNFVTNTADPMTESSLLSPFNAEEARKKISEIIESFGSGILNTDITPTHDIELDFEDLEVAPERRELALRLRGAGLLHLERLLFENGYDNYKFVNNVFEESDLQMLDIPEKDATKLLRFVNTLPKAEFQPQMLNKTEQENKPSATSSKSTQSKGVSTLSQWLNSIALPEYNESFNKHLYNTIESVCGVWDVELQTVLEINKLGHRRRILQSLVYIRQMREPKSVKTPLAESNSTNKMASNGGKEPTAVAQQPLTTSAPVQHRNSITGYRKNRPAPQPPVVPTNNNNNNNSSSSSRKPTPTPQLQIRAPSELLLGLPANLRTKWRHSANTLLNEQIKYEVYYLGSTVVKELRGTESTRKSIQKFKTNNMSSNAETQQSEQQHQLAQNSSFNRQQRRALLCLAISHRGVEFIDVAQQHTICEHEIQNINCACQDADDLRHFAYITKEQDIHYCHVFSVESTDLATEIILTLGQAFEVAYQLALRDGISTTPSALDNGLLQGEFCNAVTHK